MTLTQTLPGFLQQTALRLILFGGKGGVGKTTCAAASALVLGKQSPDRKYLLVSTDPAHSITDSLAGPSPLPNLHVMEIDAKKCLRDFKLAHAGHFRQIAQRGTFLDDHDIAQLMDLSLPGLDEVMAFNEIAKLVQRGEYESIVVDTAPTGHTLRLLELPALLQDWIGALDAMLAKHRYMIKVFRGAYVKDDTDLFLDDLSASVKLAGSVLADRRHCCFVPVAVPEPMIILETRRLIEKLKAMSIPLTDLLVNRVYPAASDCRACQVARAQQNPLLKEFLHEFSAYALWQIPLQGHEVRGPDQLAHFWDDVRELDDGGAPSADVAAVPIRVEHPAALPGPDVSMLLFAGKGGVGKTTLASATAVHLARHYEGKRILLFSTDPAHSLSDCFDTPIGPRETQLLPGLTAIEADAHAEFQHLKDLYAGEIAEFFDSLTGNSAIEIQFDREVMERFLDLSPPGLDEVMALTHISELREKNRYDLLVLDTAPTGHMLRLLEMPELIQDWLRVVFDLFLKYKNVFKLPHVTELLVATAKRLKSIRSLMADPRAAQLYAVSILTEMALEETRDMIRACGEGHMHVPVLFLNLATAPDGCALCNGIAEGESHLGREFARSFADAHQAVVYRAGEIRGIKRLGDLGRALYA